MKIIRNNKGKREFDYYIFIDYSESLVGYVIISREKIKEILLKIPKLRHYKDVKHRRRYLIVAKKKFERERIKELLFKWKIRDMKSNLDIFVDVVDFIKKNEKSSIFVSVDNNQYYSFTKLLDIVDSRERLLIVKESDLKRDSFVYRLSLIIDNILNMERRK